MSLTARISAFGGVMCLVAVLFGAGLPLMSSIQRAEARQLNRPIIAVTCEGGFGLCQAIVQALSRQSPSHAYVLNPATTPKGAFDLTLTFEGDASARLHWPGGTGAATPRNGHNDAEFARHIVANANPALLQALKGS